MDVKLSGRDWVLILLLTLTSFCSSAEAGERARNVIVLIADGCSAEQYAFARWFKGAPLSFDPYRVGAVKTHIADSVVADSAPAASAYATGVRTSSRFISVGPGPDTIPQVPALEPALHYKPMATLLEGARLMGKATGIVATSRVTHATPAAYMAHVHQRDAEEEIMEQAVHQRVHVVFGGGKGLLLPKGAGGKREDGDDLMTELAAMGYRIVESRRELAEQDEGPLFGVFAVGHMDAEIDRPELHPDQPSLEEMTRKAIQILSRDPDGFFLMVEGSQIDWACHANDPAHLLSDLLAFDKAAQAAIDFALRDKKTMVLVLSDHHTGGFSIGNDEAGRNDSQMKPDALTAPFRKMNRSAPLLWQWLGEERSIAGLKEAVRRGWAMEISERDAVDVLGLAEKYRREGLPEHYALGRVLSPRHTYVGWATHGHTGGDVPLHALGPGRPTGLLDAPMVGRVCADALGLDMERLNRRLFVDAGKEFGYGHVRVDKTDPLNPVILIRHAGKKAELPVNRHWLIVDGKARRVEGLAVYAEKTDTAYIPLQAVNMIRNTLEAQPRVSLEEGSLSTTR